MWWCISPSDTVFIDRGEAEQGPPDCWLNMTTKSTFWAKPDFRVKYVSLLVCLCRFQYGEDYELLATSTQAELVYVQLTAVVWVDYQGTALTPWTWGLGVVHTEKWKQTQKPRSHQLEWKTVSGCLGFATDRSHDLQQCQAQHTHWCTKTMFIMWVVWTAEHKNLPESADTGFFFQTCLYPWCETHRYLKPR